MTTPVGISQVVAVAAEAVKLQGQQLQDATETAATHQTVPAVTDVPAAAAAGSNDGSSGQGQGG